MIAFGSRCSTLLESSILNFNSQVPHTLKFKSFEIASRALFWCSQNGCHFGNACLALQSAVVIQVGILTLIAGPPFQVVDKSLNITEIPEWFSGCKMNFAENLLRFKDNHTALICAGNISIFHLGQNTRFNVYNIPNNFLKIIIF